MILYLPAALAVDILAIPRNYLVADNGEMALGLVAKELLEQRANDGAHAGGQNDDGNIVLLGPVIELLKVWVQLHVLLQDLDALVVGGLDTLEHEAEGVTNCDRSMVRRCFQKKLRVSGLLPEAHALLQNLIVQLAALFTTEAKVINLRRSVREGLRAATRME